MRPTRRPFGGARAQDGVRTTAAGRARIDHDPAGRADAERPRVPSAGEPQAPRALCDRPDGERDREVERRAATAEACQATGRGSRRASFAHARERPASRHLDEALEGVLAPREPVGTDREDVARGADPPVPPGPSRRPSVADVTTSATGASSPIRDRSGRRIATGAGRSTDARTSPAESSPCSRCPARSAAQKATSPGPREPTRPRARASATVAAAPSAAPRSPRRVAEASVRVEGEP